jgi:hypothetical protein
MTDGQAFPNLYQVAAARSRAGALRVALGLNAVVAAVGLSIKFFYAAKNFDPDFPTRAGRVANEFCYFTIQSNLLVIATCLLVAAASGRMGPVLAIARLTALVCITITGIVYYALLASDSHLTGVALVGDYLCHLVSPLLCIGTWLVLGPRGAVGRRTPLAVLIYPLAWAIFTLIRGAAIGFYPYNFIDVAQNGYLSVLITVAVIFLIAFGLASLARVLDRRWSPI